MRAIFIDCFDTIIFRDIHPLILLEHWAECIVKLYPSLNYKELLKCRKEAQRKRKDIYSILNDVYEKMFFDGKEDREKFINTAHEIEVELELTSHSLCKRAKNILTKAKQDNIPVYCVSDFHLTKEDLKRFFDNLKIGDLITDVFVSSEYGKTKASGELYECVMSYLNLKPDDVVMIGDNRVADIANAQKHGLNTKFYPNITKKKYLFIERRKKKKDISDEIRGLYNRFSGYEEYGVLFYTFVYRLYKMAKKEDAKTIVFLAREGFFLKELFEIYQELIVPEDERIKTKYFKCSRRAICSVQIEKHDPRLFGAISIRNYMRAIGFDDSEIERLPFECFDIDKIEDNFSESEAFSYISENKTIYESIEQRIQENSSAFKKYVSEIFPVDEKCIITDVGWLGRMQYGIEQYLNSQLIGCYLGIFGRCPEDRQPERYGLVFEGEDDNDSEKKSQNYHILRSNIILYELLLSAPHGSAQNYRYSDDGNVVVSEAWAENEKNLFKNTIESTQKNIIRIFKKVCLRYCNELVDDKKTNRIISNIVLRDAIMPSVGRVHYMELLNKGFSQNFGQQQEGLNFKANVHVSLKELIKYPERYVRYVAKVPCVFSKRKILPLYYPVAWFFYEYVKLKNKL